MPGQSGCRVRLNAREFKRCARDLGTFLSELHAIDARYFSGTLPPPVFDRLNFAVLENYFSKRLARVHSTYRLHPYDQKIRWILADAETYRDTTALCFVHGDLYHRHILFNEHHQFSGVIDWGDSSLSHRVVDLGIVFQFLPKDVHRYFFQAYDAVDDHALAYARFLGLYYAITLLWYGDDRKDQDLIRTSLWTLEEL